MVGPPRATSTILMSDSASSGRRYLIEIRRHRAALQAQRVGTGIAERENSRRTILLSPCQCETAHGQDQEEHTPRNPVANARYRDASSPVGNGGPITGASGTARRQSLRENLRQEPAGRHVSAKCLLSLHGAWPALRAAFLRMGLDAPIKVTSARPHHDAQPQPGIVCSWHVQRRHVAAALRVAGDSNRSPSGPSCATAPNAIIPRACFRVMPKAERF